MELYVLGKPLTKRCVVCGKTQPLRQREVYWPAIPPSRQSVNSMCGQSNQNFSLSFRPIVIAILIIGGSALAWNTLKPFRSTILYRNPRTDIPTLNSRPPSAVAAPMQAHDDKIAETATLPQMVASNSSPQENSKPKATSSSLAHPAEPEDAASEGTEMLSVIRVGADNGNIDHSSRDKVTIAEPAGNHSVESRKATAATVVERVSKAISARAISGVKVSYVESTLYLEGEVKTQSQRLAAEQAARNIPGVKMIRSSIRVQWATDNG